MGIKGKKTPVKNEQVMKNSMIQVEKEDNMGKTPKGKVSFQVKGNEMSGTPGNKKNSFAKKRQDTPGGKGAAITPAKKDKKMKKKTPVKKVEEEEDDSLEDEDMDEEAESKSTQSLKRKHVNEEDKDIDEDEKEIKKVKNKMGELPLTKKQKKQYDRLKELYVGNLKRDVTKEELMALSPDIIGVHFPKGFLYAKNAFAFLKFESEEKAVENYELLQNCAIRGERITLQFNSIKAKVEQQKFDEKKLVVTGMPLDTTITQVAKLFRKAYKITVFKSDDGTYKNARIDYHTPIEGRRAFDANQETIINGKKVTVHLDKDFIAAGNMDL